MSDATRTRDRLRALRVFEGALPAFDPEAAPPHPVALLWEWLSGAIDAGVREPHAMTLATADSQGRPSARVLILKGLDEGPQFAGSRASRKGQELATGRALYRLVPDEIEFWQADRERRHIRLQYVLRDRRWHHHRLWP